MSSEIGRRLTGYRVSGGRLETVCDVDYYVSPRWKITALEAARQYQRRDGGTITELWTIEIPSSEPTCTCRYWVDDDVIGHEERDPNCAIHRRAVPSKPVAEKL